MLRLPNVTEIEIYVNYKIYEFYFASFPNLEKISVINNDLLSPMNSRIFNQFDLLNYLIFFERENKKLNHVIVKNIWVVNEEKTRQYTKRHNIKLDIIWN